ncbi:hypothetical protein MKX01_021597 [Papaver californicum]|nr:hypothetical protein MKX01_021597 [Papaver californicum]
MAEPTNPLPLANKTWTWEENKKFEVALAHFGEDTPNHWQAIAIQVGTDKTAEDVEEHYKVLVKDMDAIEAGEVSTPEYEETPSPDESYGDSEEVDTSCFLVHYLKPFNMKSN